MNKSNTNQRGFGTIEILLVIVGVVALLGTGWIVYQHNRVKAADAAPSTNQEATTTEPTQTTPVPAQNTIKIAELGIQITVPDSIKDLTYQTKTATLRNGSQATIAFFSTASLAAADAKCGTDAAPLGSLSKANGQYPTESEDETNVLDYGQLVKQFPTFYVTAGHPQAGCSSKAAVQASASTYKSDFDSAQTSIQPAN